MAAGFRSPRMRLRPRLVAQGRRQDVQVQGQRARPLRHHQAVRPRPAALFSAPRNSDRKRRKFLARRIHPPGEFRPGQRLGEPRPPDPDDDPELFPGDGSRKRPKNAGGRENPRGFRPAPSESSSTIIPAMPSTGRSRRSGSTSTPSINIWPTTSPGSWPRTRRREPRLARVLYQAAAAIRGVSYLVYPVMPGSAAKNLGFPGRKRSRSRITRIADFAFDGLEAGQTHEGAVASISQGRSERISGRGSEASRSRPTPASGQKRREKWTSSPSMNSRRWTCAWPTS